MKLEEAREMVRQLVYAARGEVQLDQRALDLLLDAINKALWIRIAKQAQSHLTKLSPDVQITNGSFDFSGTLLDPAGVYRVTQVEMKSISGRYLPLDYIVSADRSLYDSPTVVATVLEPKVFFLDADVLTVAPIPAKQTTLRIEYVPKLATWAEGTEALGGRLDMHHGLIAFMVAVSLGATNVSKVRDAMEDEFRDALLKRGPTRKIRYQPYE